MNVNKNYYYFSTHTIKTSIYDRLEAGHEYSTLSDESKLLLDKLINNYPKGGDIKESPLDYCSKFINSNKSELSELLESHGFGLKFFLVNLLGYSFQWGSSTRSFGKNSSKRAELISEEELIQEMTSEKGTIKKLLDSAHGNLSSVKPFLPAIMISLETNTRNKAIMKYTHTGRFCFDFDKLKDKETARMWMNKVWEGTENVKPYLAFISPRGKGFKVFCRVDISNPDFTRDYISEDREVVMKHHKVWYEGAHKELVKKFPELKDNFDESTNDPQRLTYLPFIDSEELNFKYDKDRLSEYSKIVDTQRDHEKKELLKKISENHVEISKIMREHNITSKEDAYHLLLKNRTRNFDLDLETEKFTKTVDFLEDLCNKDDRIANWVSEKFNDYHILHKISWVLYGVFGDLAIEQIKRLIPENSNKLDEDHNDYRWAIRSKDDYDANQLSSLTPAAFYSLVIELGEVKDFLAEEFRVSSTNVSDFKILNNYYEIYDKNKVLLEDGDKSGDASEFLDEVTSYIDKKKIRLPLIEELTDIESEVILGPKDYLSKDTMTYLYQEKYKEKRIFSLRSQCKIIAPFNGDIEVNIPLIAGIS